MAEPKEGSPLRPGRAKRSLGQNFLVDRNVAGKIVDCLRLSPGTPVLEIGPGRGVLTEILLEREAALVLLEKDLELARSLKAAWPAAAVTAIDALRFDWDRLLQGAERPWQVIGNLPYNIASRLVWDVVRRIDHIPRMVFTVQREVADRLAAAPGSKAYGALSVWVQCHAQVRRELLLGPQVFRPRPKVDSAVVSLRPRKGEGWPRHPERLKRLLDLCFQSRRKQLGTILRSRWSPALEDWLAGEGLPPSVRPERLTPGQFNALSSLIKK